METTNPIVPSSTLASLENLKETVEQKLTFIPFMKIISSNTKQFKEKKAELGDFFAAEQSFGPKINVTAITYRYKLDAVNKATNRTISSLRELEGEVPFAKRPTFIEFMKKHDNSTLKKGVELLLYLVDLNLFVIFFCKGKTESAAFSIMNNSTNKQIITLTTRLEAPPELSYDWYEINVFPTGKFLEKLETKESIDKFKAIEFEPELDEQER